MITTEGRIQVKRFLGGISGSIAKSIALGTSNKAESIADTSLDFEVVRADIINSYYDFVNNKLIFKASFPENFVGTVHEVGMWSLGTNYLGGDFGSRSVAGFNTNEGWSGTFSSTAARVGLEALQHTPALSTATTSALTTALYDFSGHSAADNFVFAFNVGNAFTASIRFRFMTDASNYYDFSLGAQTAGYKVTRLTKGSAITTGSPQWSNITQIQITTTSTAGGASAISFDGIRLEDMDTFANDNFLVAREVLATPFIKTETMPQDVEFRLAVTIT